MAETLRRLFWLLPLLGLASFLLFALLAVGLPAPEGPRSELPLFVNTAPRGIRDEVTEVLRALEQAHSPEAAERLAELGGAALPHVLPQLGTLPPAAQRRVAVALAPIARRTGVARDDGVLSDPDGSLQFWTRFWQERALDFQPTVVARLVRRVGARSLALGGADLLQLDTYALPELVAQLGPIRTTQDVDRARRLLRVIGDISEQRWSVPPGSTPEQARSTVTECRRWWDERQRLFVDVTGLGRLTAAILQTRYGLWALRTLREVVGVDTSPLGRELARGARTTGPLLLSALVGSWLLGGAGLLLGRGGRRRAAWLRRGLVFTLALCVPALVLWPPARSLGGAALVCLLLGALPALLQAHRMVEEEASLDQDKSFGALLRSTLGLASVWAPLAFAELTTLVFALEWTVRLDGWGPRTVEALRQGDVPWLMAVCLSLTLLAALVQIVADGRFAALLRARSREGTAAPC